MAGTIPKAQSKDGFRVTVKRRKSTGRAATVSATASLSAVTRTRHPIASHDFVAGGSIWVQLTHPRRGLKPPRMAGRPSVERGPGLAWEIASTPGPIRSSDGLCCAVWDRQAGLRGRIIGHREFSRAQALDLVAQTRCFLEVQVALRLLGGCLPDFAGWSGYPSIAAFSIRSIPEST